MSWIAFEFLLLGFGWLGVALFKEYFQQKDSGTEAIKGAGIVISTVFTGLLGTLIYYKILMPVCLWLLAPIVFMGFIGSLEDFNRIGARTSLLFQIIATYLALYSLQLELPAYLLLKLPDWAIFSLLVLAILSVSTVLERMDKSDGFAAVQSLAVFSVMGAILYSIGIYDLAILLFGLCPVIAGFLVWNWPCAKVTLGKSGTVLLGSLMSLLALYTYEWCHIPLQIWAILMAPFLVDTLLTGLRQIIARLLFSKKLSEFPSYHAYERLLGIGWSPLQLIVGLAVLDSILAALALWAYKMPTLLTLISASTLGGVFTLYALIEWAKPMYRGWYRTSPDKNALVLPT